MNVNHQISIQQVLRVPQQEPSSSQENPIVQRRGRPRNLQVEQDLNIESELSQHWFGNDISTELLIYFCQQGSLVLHTKTGPKRGVRFQTLQYRRLLKTYRQQFRLNLIDKISQLMKTYNLDPQIKNTLVCFNGELQDIKKKQFEEITQLVETQPISSFLFITLNQLSTQFQPTFLYVLKCVFDDIYDINSGIYSLTAKILDWITENKDANQLILKLQSIQSLINKDANVFYELVEQQDLLLGHFNNKTQVEPITQELLEESQESYIIHMQFQRLGYVKHSWLYRFISGLVIILKKYIRL